MSNGKNGFKAFVSSALGAAASCAVLFLASRYGHAPWLSPGALFSQWVHGSVAASWAMSAAVGVAFGLIYTSWFDQLFTGGPLTRGLKFGLVAFAWSMLGVSVAHGFWFGGIHAPNPILYVSALLGSSLALGAVSGVAYGMGQAREEYTYGLGYGLPDRQSLVQ